MNTGWSAMLAEERTAVGPAPIPVTRAVAVGVGFDVAVAPRTGAIGVA